MFSGSADLPAAGAGAESLMSSLVLAAGLLLVSLLVGGKDGSLLRGLIGTSAVNSFLNFRAFFKTPPLSS